MKTKASTFLKQMVSTIVAVVKAKSTVVRAKTRALKTRLLILCFLRNKKLVLNAINTKIDAIIGQQLQDGHNDSMKEDGASGGGADDDVAKAIELYSAASAPSYSFSGELSVHEAATEEEEEDNDEYVTHTLFVEEDDELVRALGSVIDVVRDAREREGGDGAEFQLEDEIDHVADVFTRRQLKLQKLDSFKRFCETLERGA